MCDIGMPEGMKECKHCNGYGSSFKDEGDGRCGVCGGSGLVKKVEPPVVKMSEATQKYIIHQAEMVTAVCPYCYQLKKEVKLGIPVYCMNCDQSFLPGNEIISIRVKVKGVPV